MPCFLAISLEQNTQENEAVRHLQDISVMKVELELRVGAFANDVVKVPAEAFREYSINSPRKPIESSEYSTS